MTDSIDTLASLIASSSKIAILTGAGISTSAGIPDFRGPGGLYSRTDIPVDMLFDINYFRNDPTLLYTTIPDFLEKCTNAQISSGHMLVKKIEDSGKLLLLVTQNIDGLHQKAGNKNPVDMHGNFDSFVCMDCRRKTPMNGKIKSSVLAARTPLCPSCGGILKPEVVFFGEQVIGFEESAQAMQKADLFIAIGTSLVVNPAASLPQYLPHSAAFAIINKGKTPYDKSADIHIEEDIDFVSNKIMESLGWI